MATLYEIDGMIMDVLTSGFVVDEETGEIVFDSDDLDGLEAERDSKIEACALFVKSLEADCAAIRAEEKALADRRKAKEAKAEKMRGYIAHSMEINEQRKFETARCALSFRRSEIVQVADDAKLPERFVVRKVTEAPDKAKLKKALKSGESVAGVSLVEKNNLQIK